MYECPLTEEQVAAIKNLSEFARHVDAEFGPELASRARALMLSMTLAGDEWKEHVADISAVYNRYVEPDSRAHHRPTWAQERFQFAPDKFADFLDSLASSCQSKSSCKVRKVLWRAALEHGVYRPGLTDAALRRRLVEKGRESDVKSMSLA